MPQPHHLPANRQEITDITAAKIGEIFHLERDYTEVGVIITCSAAARGLDACATIKRVIYERWLSSLLLAFYSGNLRLLLVGILGSVYIWQTKRITFINMGRWNSIDTQHRIRGLLSGNNGLRLLFDFEASKCL